MSPDLANPAFAPARSETQPSGIRSVIRSAFSFPVMLAFALAMLAVLTVQDRFHDPDLWWHLKAGELIVTTGSVPTTDPFSFTAQGSAWTAHEWLSEVIFFEVWKAGRQTGLMLGLCFLTALLLITQYAFCRSYSGSAKVALVGALIGWYCSTSGLALRPHMIGYLLLTLELLIVQVGRTSDARWFYALPPLFAIWINCHGSFVFGLLILAVMLVCGCFEFRAGLLTCKAWPLHVRKTGGFALVISVAALFLNPLGWKLLIYPFDTLFLQNVNLNSVSEWQPLTLQSERGWGVFFICAALAALVILRRAEVRMVEIVLAAMGLVLALQHQRMVFVFGLLVAPLASRLMAEAYQEFDTSRDLPFANAVLMAFFALGIYWGFPTPQNLEQQVQKNNPVKAVEYVRQAGLTGPMLNEYGYGGYLIWALPEHKVFIDGRADVYEWAGVMKETADWYSLAADPHELLDKYGIRFCLLDSRSPMAMIVRLLPGWKQVYQDEQAIVLARRN